MSDSERPAETRLRVEDYRRVREELERGILPLATSLDGRAFTFQASLHHLRLRTGGYVVLEEQGPARLGQILAMHPDQMSVGDLAPGRPVGDVQVRGARGSGVVLEGDGRAFHDARVRLATPSEVDGWLARRRPDRARLRIGDLLLAPGVPAALDAGGFNRHTFMCGQSGSGKTYSLGLVLERLLLETSLRMVVLDPNSDYVGLGEAREGVEPSLASAYADAARDVRVWRNDPEARHRLRLRFAEVDTAAQAAVLGLDPVADREEYAALTELLETSRADRRPVPSLDALRASDSPEVRRLGLRAANLGVLDWSIWSGGEGRSLVEELEEPTSRCVVVDLGSLATAGEQRLVSESVLATLWRNRRRREPCLVVIDEAHHVCPSRPTDAVTALASDLAALIAAEGRKFGLFLLTSTQRPQKVSEEVLSQSDNLLLMRMNSEADLDYLGDVFSFIPSGLIARATTFDLGEALVAGRLHPHPAYVRFGERISHEGGADVSTDWARPIGPLAAGPTHERRTTRPRDPGSGS